MVSQAAERAYKALVGLVVSCATLLLPVAVFVVVAYQSAAAWQPENESRARHIVLHGSNDPGPRQHHMAAEEALRTGQ